MPDASVGQSGARIVVVISTLDERAPHVQQLSSERYVADSIGQALEAHAPDPAPGAVFKVEYVGRARPVGAEADATGRGRSGVTERPSESGNGPKSGPTR